MEKNFDKEEKRREKEKKEKYDPFNDEKNGNVIKSMNRMRRVLVL